MNAEPCIEREPVAILLLFFIRVHRFRLNAFQYIETDFSQIAQQKRYTATHMNNDCRNLLLNDAPQSSGVIILRIIIAHEYAIVNVTADFFFLSKLRAPVPPNRLFA